MPTKRSNIPKAFEVHQVVVSTRIYGLSTLTMEDKHLHKIDSWYFSYLKRQKSIKASYYSKISNKKVWQSANISTLPSQTILSQLLQLLVGCIQATPSDPLPHVVVSLGVKDRVAILKNRQRGPHPPHWLGHNSKRPLEFFTKQCISKLWGVSCTPGGSAYARLYCTVPGSATHGGRKDWFQVQVVWALVWAMAATVDEFGPPHTQVRPAGFKSPSPI